MATAQDAIDAVTAVGNRMYVVELGPTNITTAGQYHNAVGGTDRRSNRTSNSSGTTHHA